MPDRESIPGQSAKTGCPVFAFKRLSPREKETLGLAAQGLTDLEIARRLHLVPRTVRMYLQAARGKLGALNTTHAVAIGVATGLIEIDTFFMDKVKVAGN